MRLIPYIFVIAEPRPILFCSLHVDDIVLLHYADDMVAVNLADSKANTPPS